MGRHLVTLLGEIILVDADAPNFTALNSRLAPVTLSSQKGKAIN